MFYQLFVFAILFLHKGINKTINQKSYEELLNENELLRKENQKLRQKFVREGNKEIVLSKEPYIPLTTEEKSKIISTDPNGEYWLSFSNKRHNSKCRYFKASSGKPCGKNDGNPCKICGG